MTDLIQRLAEGPGSRELSQEVLTALGYAWTRSGYWLNTKTSRALYTQGGEIVRNPTESVDDALALVPEGWEPYTAEWGNQLVEIEIWDQVEFAKGRAKGDNPLSRAICIAVLNSV